MTVRWGIAGPGSIATGFAEGMTLVDDGEIVAVGSRSLERADEFADRFGVAHRHGSYEDLAADPDVDVVYVATPQSRHMEDTLLFIEAGKHVLCEKPLALNAAQGRQMVDAARARGLFLMEAIWTRFLPSYRALAGVLEEGRIGDPILVEADFGFRAPFDPTHRLFDLSLGGGCVLDLGVYPIQLCSMVLGAPDRIVAEGHIGDSGVDELVAAVLHHAGGRLGVVKAAIRANMACTARISGTDGVIELPAFMHCPDHIVVSTPGGSERLDGNFEGNGLRFQVHEVHRCLAEGLTESPTMPLEESLSIAATMDSTRAAIGMRYSDEGEHRAS